MQARPRGFFDRHGAKLVISLTLGAGLGWLLTRGGLPIVPPREAFATVRPWAVAVYVLSLLVVHLLRAVRWRHLLRPVGHVPLRSVVAVSFIAFAAILFSPFRSGEIVRPYLITRRGSVRLWEATGTVGAERIIDGLVLSVTLFVALLVTSPLQPLPDHVGDLKVPVSAVPGAAYGVLALFAVAFVTMALFFWRRDFARRMVRAIVGPLSPALAERLSDACLRVAEGLSFLPSVRHTAPFMLETLGYWFANAGGMLLLAWGCGLDTMTFAESCVLMGTIGIGILVPAGPGFFGTFQLASFMALAMYFPEPVLKGAGAAFVFLLYAAQIVWHLATALFAIVWDAEPKKLAQATEPM